MTARVSCLDFQLGLRMLIKYPGLTVVGGLAMAFGIWLGAAGFEYLRQTVWPELPLDDGGRVVGVRLWDARQGGPEERAAHDFVRLRDEVESIDHLGAYWTVERNLITDDGGSEPVAVAEMSAAGFRVARVPPLLGRALDDADERPGAAPVVVIGHDVWQARFGGDPEILGREVRLGDTPHTVVGVMPEGFRFPFSHSLWTPLPPRVREFGPREGPEMRIFGRLAPGVHMEQAQAELAALGRRAAADLAETHEHLRPEVLPYAWAARNMGLETVLAVTSMNVTLVLLLVLVCGNVALLMFARAASRRSEIVVRTALGATRARIAAQLFAEALVLGLLAAAVGLAGARLALSGWLRVQAAEAGGRLAFWMTDEFSPVTVLYALGLAVLAAAIAGILPAIKVTAGVGGQLRQAAAGAGGLRLGGIWTAVILAQVAVTVAFPATAFVAHHEVAAFRSHALPFAADEYISVVVDVEREPLPGGVADSSRAALVARAGASLLELERRLETDPAVASVTFADRLPLMYHGPERLELEGDARGEHHRAGSARVAVDYFDALEAPVLSGRSFDARDVAPEARAVIVNRSFVERVLGGRNPLGRRVRYAVRPGQEPGAWYEIVGVVPDLGMINDLTRGAGLYHPAPVGEAFPLHMAVRARGDARALAQPLRATAAAVDPRLRLDEILPLETAGFRDWSEMAYLFRGLAIVSVLALLLSLAAIYAVMSFTVAQRTREIGVRVALGADARRLVADIFRRPLTQVGMGVVAGAGLTALLVLAAYEGRLTPLHALVVVGYAAVMMGVCLLACVVPTRRALSIEPTEALRADA